ncbi:MAG: TetR/AcrR family transcriptional regulator [Gammaproteobacteria bacterium]|nr:TetR/AcrR family transcriptional regulator [Gammaproteobacteria bacterium]MDH5302685.1 TetR/AcrR family transcriptional regulator [Gammaproteobacteria bacterium]MDH5320878.1 TetR/AcrR family transcriptional regulator [Gammaproteobacteria bacterium]
MSQPRFQRRKEDRPQEITAAALAAFAKNGYAATRVDDVAKRAGVSKGLLYLYFKTKEELFKSVVRSFVIPRIDTLIRSIETSDMSSEEFLRGPFLEFARKMPGSPISVIVRLMVAEGPKHPDLVQFYWDNVVSRGLGAIDELLRRGVQRGEFRQCAISEQPALFVMPVVFAVIFKLIFGRQSIDTERLIETQIDLLITHLQGPAT